MGERNSKQRLLHEALWFGRRRLYSRICREFRESTEIIKRSQTRSNLQVLIFIHNTLKIFFYICFKHLKRRFFISANFKYHLNKFLSLLSVVRGYNIAVIVIAQYLTSIYILSYSDSLSEVLLNPTLFLIVLSSSLVIAAGYIINNFYDSEKDVINKPGKFAIDNVVSKRTKLGFYFLFNFLAAVFSLMVSFRAALFMGFYSFLIWIYSHKLKRITFIGNILAAVLAVFPFFAIFLYYGHVSLMILLHASFLYILILVRELLKDMHTYRGDLIYGYQTIPVRYSLNTSRAIITFLVVLCLALAYVLTTFHQVGAMRIYFYFSLGVLAVLEVGLWSLAGVKWYLFQYNIIKFLIVAGVFSIVLISY